VAFSDRFGVATIGFVVGRSRALASAGGDSRNLHSLPVYYGSNVGLKAVVPAFFALIVWLLVQPLVVNQMVSGMIPDSSVREGSSLGLVMAEVRRTADGIDTAIDAGLMTEVRRATCALISPT
jgi:phosphate transport system permease protein